MLKTLKNAARSVEALGRGTVERYYWKRLAESSCGREVEWQTLANLNNKRLEVSQLDYLPHDWLLDSNDWGQVFANVVSPEISKCFSKKMQAIMGAKASWDIKSGPPKTLARTLAKGCEYRQDFLHQHNIPRWLQFAKNFKDFRKKTQ